MKKLSLSILVIIVVLFSACATPPTPPAPAETPTPITPTPTLTSPPEREKLQLSELTETKKVIKTEAKGVTVYYQQKSFYSGGDFSAILEKEDEFNSDLIEKFSSTASSYGKEVANARVELDSEKRFAALTCNVNEVISKTGNRYYSTFEWLIRPLGLDFLDDHFKRSGNQLSWEGSINGVPTTILLTFPSSINNCHAHVWWEEQARTRNEAHHRL